MFNNIFVTALIICGCGATLMGAIWFAQKLRESAVEVFHNNLDDRAHAFGLTPVQPETLNQIHTVRGTYRDTLFELDCVSDNEDDSPQENIENLDFSFGFYNQVRATLPNPLPIKLTIQPAGKLSKLQRSLGLKGVETGDSAFDDLFDISSDTPEQALKLLTSEVRSLLQEFLGMGDTVTFKDNMLTYLHKHYFGQPEEIKDTIQLQTRFVDALQAAQHTQGVEEPQYAHATSSRTA